MLIFRTLASSLRFFVVIFVVSFFFCLFLFRQGKLGICLQCIHLMLTVCTQHVLTTVLVYKYANYTFVDNLFIFVSICTQYDAVFLLTIDTMCFCYSRMTSFTSYDNHLADEGVPLISVQVMLLRSN